jgi:DNA-binding beta-propeller fold protein YncE
MKKYFKHLGCFFFVLLLFNSIKLPAQSKIYDVIGSINIGGEGRWDYLAVDTSMHRLYVSHGTKVDVIDLNSNREIGQITGLNGVHGIAFAVEFGKGFISSGRDSSVTVFDLNSLRSFLKIKVTGRNPDAIVYDPFSQRIFTFNGGSNNATAINPKTGEVEGTIELDGKPEYAVSDVKGRMYVNLEDKNAIEVFDPLNLKIISRWPIDPVAEPSGLAIDRENKRLFSVGRNKLMGVVNAETGSLITTLPIGGRVDGCAYDPYTHLIFSSNGEGTVTIIKEDTPDSYEMHDNVVTQVGARTIALDPTTHKIYTSALIEEPSQKDKENKPVNPVKSFGVIILGRVSYQ